MEVGATGQQSIHLYALIIGKMEMKLLGWHSQKLPLELGYNCVCKKLFGVSTVQSFGYIQLSMFEEFV